MTQGYKKIDGTPVSLVNHILETIKNKPIQSIHVGTDSQNIGRKTVIVTVVAFRYGLNTSMYNSVAGKGVHYVYKRERLKKIRDIHTRLFMEADKSITLANWLREQIPTINLEIDLDFNSDETYTSNKLVAQTKGWAEGLGFKVNIKPNRQVATRAADHLCR